MGQEIDVLTGLPVDSQTIPTGNINISSSAVRPIDPYTYGNVPSHIGGLGDISKFANQIYSKNPLPDYRDYESLQYGLGDYQSTLDQFTNGFLKAVATVPSKVVQGFGHVGGFLGWMGDGFDPNQFSQVYDNAIVNAASRYEEMVGEALPIYSTREYEEGNFINKLGSAKFWANDGFDALSFLASAYIPGGIFMRGAAAIGNVLKAAGAGNKILKAIRVLGFGAGAVYNGVSESGFEAKESFDSIFNTVLNTKIQNYLEQGYDQQTATELGTKEAKEIAGKGAARVFNANLQVLLPSSFWEMKAFFGNPLSEIDDYARKIWRKEVTSSPTFADDLAVANKIVRPTLTKEGFKQFGQGVIVEGLWEEGLQSAIQSFESKKAQGLEYNTGSMLTDYFGEWFKGLETADQWSSMFLGALVGGVMGVGGAYKNITKKQKEFDFAEEQVKKLKDTIAASVELFPDLTEQLYEIQEDGSLVLNNNKAINAAKQLGYEYDYIKERIVAMEKGDNLAVDFLDRHYMGRRLFAYLNNPYYKDTNEAFEQFKYDLTEQAEKYKTDKENQFANVTSENLEKSLKYIEELKEVFNNVIRNNKSLMFTGDETRFELNEKEIAKKVIFHEAIKQSFFDSYLSQLKEVEDPGIEPEMPNEDAPLEDLNNYFQNKKVYDEKKKDFDERQELKKGVETWKEDSKKLSNIMQDSKKRKKIIEEYIDEHKEYLKLDQKITELESKKIKTQEDIEEIEKLVFEISRSQRINGTHYFDRISNKPGEVDQFNNTLFTDSNSRLGIKDSYYKSLGENKKRKDNSIEQIKKQFKEIDQLLETLEQGYISEIDQNGAEIKISVLVKEVREQLLDQYYNAMEQLSSQIGLFFSIKSSYSFFTQEDYDLMLKILNDKIEEINDRLDDIVATEESTDIIFEDSKLEDETREQKLDRIQKYVDEINEDAGLSNPIRVNSYNAQGNLIASEPSPHDDFLIQLLSEFKSTLKDHIKILEEIIKPKIDSNLLFKDYETKASDPKFFEDVFLKNFWITDINKIFDQIQSYLKYGENNEMLFNLLTAYESILRRLPTKIKVAKDFYESREDFKEIFDELDNLLKIYETVIKPLLDRTKEQRSFLQKQSETNNRINLWKNVGVELSLNEDGNLSLPDDSLKNPILKLIIDYLGTDFVSSLLEKAANNFDNVRIIDDSEGINFNIGYLFKLLDTIKSNSKSKDGKKTREEFLKELGELQTKYFDTYRLNFFDSNIYSPVYKEFPDSLFGIMIANLAGYNLTNIISDPQWSKSVIGQFLKHRSIEKMKEHIKNVEGETNSAGGKLSLDELKLIIEAHEKYSSVTNLINYIKNNQKNITEFIDKLLPIIEGETLSPNFQQLVSLKELYDFIYSDDTFSYLMGIAGTGKSKLISSYIVKLTGIKLENILATSYSNVTSENIKNSVNPNQPVITIDTIIADPSILSGKELLIVDEFDALKYIGEVDSLTRLIINENNNRKAKKEVPLKVIFLGDFTQIKRKDSLESNMDTWLTNFSDKATIRNISPLSIAYRSDVGAINSTALAFQDVIDDITSLETKVSDNIDNAEALGVQIATYSESDKILPDILKRLTATKDSDRKKTIIIGNESQRSAYEELRNSSGFDFNIMTFGEAHGQTLDEVYIDIRIDSFQKMQTIPVQMQYNTALYTAISRAQSYVLLGSNNEKFKTIIDKNIGDSSKINEQEKKNIKKNVSNLLMDIKQAYNLEDIEKVEDQEDEEEKDQEEAQTKGETKITPEDVTIEEDDRIDDEIDEQPEEVQPQFEASETFSDTEDFTESDVAQKIPKKKNKLEYVINSPSAKVPEIKPEGQVKPGDKVYVLLNNYKGEKIISLYVKIKDDKGKVSYKVITRMYVSNLDNPNLSPISKRMKEIIKDIDESKYFQSFLNEELSEDTFNGLNKYKLNTNFKIASGQKMRFVYSYNDLNVSPENMIEDMKIKLLSLITNGSGEQYGDIEFAGVYVVDDKYYAKLPKGFKSNVKGSAMAEFNVIIKVGKNNTITKTFYVRLNARKAKAGDAMIAPILSFYNHTKKIESVLSTLNKNYKLNTREFNKVISIFKNDFHIKNNKVEVNKKLRSSKEILKELEPYIPEITEEIIDKIKDNARQLIPLLYTSTKKSEAVQYSISNYVSFIKEQIVNGNVNIADANKFLDKILKLEYFSQVNNTFLLDSPTFRWDQIHAGVTPHILKILLNKKKINDSILIRELRHRGVNPNDLQFTIQGPGGLIDSFNETISKNSFIALKDGSGYYAYDPRAGKIVKVKEKNDKFYVSKKYYQKLKGDEELTKDEYQDVIYNTLTGKNSPLTNTWKVYARANKNLNNKPLVLGKKIVKFGEHTAHTLTVPHLFQYNLEFGEYKDNQFYGILRVSFNDWISKKIKEYKEQKGLNELEAAILLTDEFREELTVQSKNEYYDGILLQSQYFKELKEQKYIGKLKTTSAGLDLSQEDIERTLISFMKKHQIPFLYNNTSEIISDDVINKYLSENSAQRESESQTISTEDLDTVFNKKNIKNETFKENSPFISFGTTYIEERTNAVLHPISGTDKKKAEKELMENFRYNLQEVQPTRISIYEDSKEEPESKQSEQPKQSDKQEMNIEMEEEIDAEVDRIEAKKADIERRRQEDFQNENESYRVIVGDEAFNDIVESGVVRTNANNKGGQTIAEKLAKRPTLYPSFSKGKASIEYANANPNNYIIVTEDSSIQPSTSGRHGKGTTMFPTDKNGNHLKELSGEKVKVYKHIGNGEYILVYANGNKINAKYDVEYIDEVKKGELTKQQAKDALKEIGRLTPELEKQIDDVELDALEQSTETKEKQNIKNPYDAFQLTSDDISSEDLEESNFEEGCEK